MKNINKGPGKKEGLNKDDSTSRGLNSNKTENNPDNSSDDKSRNYMNGKDDIEGPDFDKLSKGAEGDSGQNAGVFK